MPRVGERSPADLTRLAVLGAFAVFAAFGLVACMHQPEGEMIIPASEREAPESGLGPGVRHLSTGPGDKGSPSFGPNGESLAFIVDGYAVEKTPDSRQERRLTTKDFGAEKVVWASPYSLMILGIESPPSAATSPQGGAETPRSIYRSSSGEENLSVSKVVSGGLAMSAFPQGGNPTAARGVVAALQAEPASPDRQPGGALASIQPDGELGEVSPELVRGTITGLSFSPDGRQVVVAVRTREDPVSFEIHLYDFSGETRLLARLDEGEEVFGTPQWTRRGIYYVSGREETDESGKTRSTVYRLPNTPEGEIRSTPEPASGVGEDFVASSIRVSPEGERLAIVGRRNPVSPANLYVLDLSSDKLKSVTENEDMEIKTGSDDLAWTPDGEKVAIVARASVSGPRVRASPAESLLEDFYNLYSVPAVPEEAPR